MAIALPVTSGIRFHLSLNVADLARSVDFYRILFGSEPAKRRPDYAKFELDDPPLVLSLEPTPRSAGGRLNHLGFRMADAAALVAMQERLERAGIRSQREEGVECCYARQTKFWVQDPDSTLWEIYTLEGDIDHRGAGQSLEAVFQPGERNVQSAPVVWEHRLGEAIPSPLPLADNTADEIRLRGTLNLPLSGDVPGRLMREAYRALKPGGRLFVHVLVGDRSLERPQLPGPAAAVQHVPEQSWPVGLLEQGGFQRVHMVKFDAKPCFERQGVAMRELQLEGSKGKAGNGSAGSVLYRGPFRQVVDDSGMVFTRAQWTSVPAAAADWLRQGEAKESFVILD
jgi:catechol 2,3-dioxygenase-like lactoylglutathione lyase family enzyme